MTQIAFAATFLPAYAELPRKAQKKTHEFLRKFVVDPKQASIHLEPLHFSLDPLIRSARIGDDYRAILRAPDTGSTYILLWIDHHDEAYRWAASKRTEIHPATGTVQLYDVAQAERAVALAGATLNEASASTEPTLFAGFSDEDIFVGGVPRPLIPAVRAVTTESELDTLLPHLPEEAADYLAALIAGYSKEDALAHTLGRLHESAQSIAAQSIAASTVADDIDSALLRPGSLRQFHVFESEFDLEAALEHPLDLWRVYLHPTQRELVRRNTAGPFHVIGGAGTGKTVVALHRVVHLVRNVFTRPDDRILVTTFTRNLAVDLHDQLATLLEPLELARVDVRNLDGWAADYLAAKLTGGDECSPVTGDRVRDLLKELLATPAFAGLASPASPASPASLRTPEFLHAEWNDVVQALDLRTLASYLYATRPNRHQDLSREEREALWPVFEALRARMTALKQVDFVEVLRRARKHIEAAQEDLGYRAAVVDETQDLSIDALRLIRAIVGPEHPNDIFLVGDAHQRIYGTPNALQKGGIHVDPDRRVELRLNYRTTAAICRWSSRALGTEHYDDLAGGLVLADLSSSLRQGEAPLLRGFANYQDELVFVSQQIQRLLADGVLASDICVTARQSKTVFAIAGALSDQSIPAVVVDHKGLSAYPSDAVRVATMHRIKGLEFSAVFALGVNAKAFPYDPTVGERIDPALRKLAEVRDRCLLYVALTRARDHLFVSYWGEPSPFLADLEKPAATAAVPKAAVPKAAVPAVAKAAELAALTASTPNQMADLTSSRGLDSRALPLSRLNLPKRMLNWAERRGIVTVGELLRFTPDELQKGERGIGRLSVTQTAAALENLGIHWDAEARESQDTERPEGEGNHAATLKLATWDGYRASLSDSQRATPWRDLDLPGRMQNFCERSGFTSLGELAEFSHAVLTETPNLGRRSIADSRTAIEEYFSKLESAEALWQSGFLPAWRSLVEELPLREAQVLRLRSGLDVQGMDDGRHTLEQIAGPMNVTRERIRQMEAKLNEGLRAKRRWMEVIEQRFTEATKEGGAVAIDALAAQPWFAGVADELDALEYFCASVLEGRWYLLTIGGEAYLSRHSKDAFEAAGKSLLSRARQWEFPCAREDLRHMLGETKRAVGAVLSELLWEELCGELQLEPSAAGTRREVLGVGRSTREPQILGWLNAQPEPVPTQTLIDRFGRGVIPDEVLYLAHGRIGLKRHVPGFDQWARTLGPRARQIIEEQGADRQWDSEALRQELAEEAELPEWLDKWHLAAMLKAGPTESVVGLEYVGRLRFRLHREEAESGEASRRVFIHEELHRILTDAGKPLELDDILHRLRAVSSAPDATITLRLRLPPFVRIDDSHWGLLVRDLPGGTEAAQQACDFVAELLDRRQRGLSRWQLKEELGRLSTVHHQWTVHMANTVVRGDSRFRLSKRGNVGLHAWESVRVPTMDQLVQGALDRNLGRIRIDSLQDRIAAIYGDRPERLALGLMINRVGWGLDGAYAVPLKESA